MTGVSIIIPVYNSEKYLNICLKSLVCQTLKDIEIIVINDGSEDKSEEIIKKYEKKYNFIKYYSLKNNKGLGYVRNLGMEKATKKYIGFVDSDDYVEFDMFEKLYNKIEETNSDVCECNFIWEYPNKLKNDIREKYLLKDSFIKMRVLAPNKIYKRELLVKNNIKFAENLKYEDILFTYSLIPFIKTISFDSGCLYHYVQRSGSLINHQDKRVADIYEILEQVINFYKSNNLYEKYHEELEYIYVRLIFLSSFKRACKIKNRNDKKEILNKGYDLVNEKYPSYKNNKYLKEKGLKNKYIKCMNKFVYNIMSYIL